MAIADRIGVVVDSFFSNPTHYTTGSAFLALLGYTVQIWADFSGYTDMGRGVAKMFGINLPENFFSPYLSKKPSDFWKRWHVTLSQWIRDYIYIPLGGADGTLLKTMAVLVIIMVISGLWHGAAFTFLIWGLYHGFLLMIERIATFFSVPIFESKFAILITFILIMIGWLIFRSESLKSLSDTIMLMSGAIPEGTMQIGLTSIIWGVGCCILYHFIFYTVIPKEGAEIQMWTFNKKIQRVLSTNEKYKAVLSGICVALLMIIALLMRVADSSTKFIYFQF